MSRYSEADKTVREAIEALYPALLSVFSAIQKTDRVDLQGNDITMAVLLRLRSYFKTQSKIKVLLDKTYAAPAADFFVETTCFFLKAVLSKLYPSISVKSEKTTKPKKRAMRPDITIWEDNKLLAAIECKTQLGWSRSGWLKQFENREKKLTKEAPTARMFLLVMSESNWHGFGDDDRAGKQFFVLLNKTWPTDLEIPIPPNVIVHTFEMLVTEIIEYIKMKVK
jgi:hypothetical protein